MGKYIFYRRLACVLFALLFVSCAPAISNIPTVIATLSPTGTSGLSPVPSQTALAVPASTPSLHFYYPKVDKLCPEKREVSFDRLGISNDLKIILSDPNQTGLWRLDVDTPTPQLIQKLTLDKWISNSISPDGKRLAYTISNLDHSFSTWILSLDSGEQHEIINIDYLEGATSSARWLSQNELLVVGSCAGAGCPFPLEVINTDTGESLDVSGVDREPYDEFQTFYVDTGKYYALYSEGNAGDDHINFYVYEFLTHQKIQVFPWLQDRIYFYPYIGTNLGMDFDLDKIIVMVEQSYGFDIGVVDNSLEALTQSKPYDVVMQRVFANTGTHFDRLRYSLIGLNSAANTLFLSMSYRNYIDTSNNIADFKVSDVERAFFSFDYQNVIKIDPVDYLAFKDYCFPMTEEYFIGVSPDGLIAVFGSEINFALMNLETGNISRLSGWSFIGWAK